MKKILWVCLLTLAVVMSFASQVSAFLAVPCCTRAGKKLQWPVEKCYEQFPGRDCEKHAYLIKSRERWACITPDSKWLKLQLWKRKISCRPLLGTPKLRFQDVEEDVAA